MTTKRTLSIQYAAHASVSDWSSTPGTLKFLRPSNEIALDMGHNYVDREGYQTANGNPIASRQTTKAPAVPDMAFDMFGLSGGGAGDGVAPSSLDHSLRELLESLASASLDTTAGKALGTQTSASLLTYASGTVANNGAALLVTGADGFVQARESYGGAGSTSIPCRALTTAAGVSQYALDASNVYAAESFFFGNGTPNRSHLYFDIEGKDFRRELFGVLAQASIEAPGNGIARLMLSNVMCTDWKDSAEASPTYAAPTQGNEIKNQGSPCWIGSTLYQASNLKVDLGLTIEPRAADGAPNGHFGFVVTEVVPRLSFRLRHGTITGPSEVTDATFETLKADGTHDILYQVGNTPGRAMAFRAPSADLKVKQVIGGGQIAYDVEALCCDTTGHAAALNSYPLRLHIF